MPIPEPNPEEEQNTFLGRCMGDDTMGKEYSDQGQRSAICYSLWRQKHPDSRRQEALSQGRIAFNGLEGQIFSASFAASSEGSHSFFLSTGPALALGELKVKDGVPSQLFRKEVIRVGHFVKDEDGIEFEVTPGLLKHWKTTFDQMKAGGVDVPIPAGHTDDPENNHGFVRDMFVEGNSLYNIMELIGEGSIDLAKRNHVSVYVPPKFVDGKGNVYKRPILHVALTPNPVIPGLGNWEAVAASFSLKGKEMNWKEVQEGLGIEDEMTDETAGKLILTRFKGLKEKQEELQLAFDELKKVSEKGDENGKPPVVKPDPMLVKLSIENRLMKLNGLVEAARITPAVRDKLEEQYASEESLTLTLSRGGDNFDTLVAALAENNPVELAEKSGPQTMLLSMNTADGKNPVVEDAKRRAEEAKAPV